MRDSLAGVEFSDRVNDVFSSLGSGLVKHDDEDQKSRNAKPDFEKQQLERCLKAAGVSKQQQERCFKPQEEEEEGQEFKRPRLVAENVGRGMGRGGKVHGPARTPGWKKNPEAYTKYSLADVPELTNSGNTAAAFDFLSKLK